MRELLTLLNSGRFDEAVARGEALRRTAPSVAVYSILASAYGQLGLLDKAAECYAAASGLEPGNPRLYSNLGATLAQLGRYHDAAQCFTQAVALAPAFVDGHYNLGLALSDAQHFERAIEAFDRAIELKPDFAEAYNNRGSALSQLRRLDEAVASYRSALRFEPDFAFAYNNLGNALLRLGRSEDAVGCFQRAIGSMPDLAEAHNNLGIALVDLRKFEEAIECFKRSFAIRPTFADPYFNLGNAFAELRRPDLAIGCFKRAVACKPDHARAIAHMLNQKASICDWGHTDMSVVPHLGITGDAIPPFSMLSLEDHPERHRMRSERFAQREFAQRAAARPAPPTSRPKKLKIGYFSADFDDHAGMRLIARLFEVHDRDRVEVHAFSYGAGKQDAMRARVEAAFDAFHDVQAMSNREIAALARRAGVAVAVDLTGHTLRARTAIFAHRAAPVQINFLGYPGTMGASFYDYIVADMTIIPEEAQRHFTERVIYMPYTYQVNDNTRPISERAPSRQEMGLPDEGFVFCCFNGTYKITSAEFGIWMRLLSGVDGSVLWLLKSNEWAAENLKCEASKRGISPERIVFASPAAQAEHLARQGRADLFLDTFNVNAHTTASDALWAGLPVITKLGAGFAARVAASTLNAIGLSELITTDERSYEALALELALNPERLKAIREKLALNRLSAPLFDTEQFARHFEKACELAYQRYFEGKAPDTIRVPN